MHIADYLVEQQVSFEPLLHPPAFTAQKRAKYLHVKGRQVAKAVLLRGPGGYLLTVLPATHEIDGDVLAGHLGGQVRLASRAEVAEVFRDCEWGVANPFGNLYGVPTLLEEAITPDMVIVLEAHSQFEAVRLSCADFERLAGPRRLRFAYKREG
jgi:Ala-tRNA(Pro) deacylase